MKQLITFRHRNKMYKYSIYGYKLCNGRAPPVSSASQLLTEHALWLVYGDPFTTRPAFSRILTFYEFKMLPVLHFVWPCYNESPLNLVIHELFLCLLIYDLIGISWDSQTNRWLFWKCLSQLCDPCPLYSYDVKCMGLWVNGRISYIILSWGVPLVVGDTRH